MKLRDRKPAQFLMAFALSLIVTMVLITLISFLNRPLTGSNYKWFYVNGKEFDITYVVTSESQLMHGLMNTTITNSTTMLFEFGAPGDYPFWMYDTYSDLDIIWIDYGNAGGTVVYIAKNATNCFVKSECAVYDPGVVANYVIEAKAGFVGRNNISVGNRIVLR